MLHPYLCALLFVALVTCCSARVRAPRKQLITYRCPNQKPFQQKRQGWGCVPNSPGCYWEAKGFLDGGACCQTIPATTGCTLTKMEVFERTALFPTIPGKEYLLQFSVAPRVSDL